MRWGSGWPQSSLSSLTSSCSKCFCGSCCLACLWNWSLDCLSLSSRSFTGSMRDSVAQQLVNLASWVPTQSSIQTVSPCWELLLQSSWRERWVTDLSQTDEVVTNAIYSLMPGSLKFWLIIIKKKCISRVYSSPLNCESIVYWFYGKCRASETLHSIEMISILNVLRVIILFYYLVCPKFPVGDQAIYCRVKRSTSELFVVRRWLRLRGFLKKAHWNGVQEEHNCSKSRSNKVIRLTKN